MLFASGVQGWGNGWLAAWRTSATPAAYWRRADARAHQGLPRLRRMLLPLVCGTALSGFTTYLIVWFTVDALRAGSGITGKLCRSAALDASLSLLLLAAVLAGYVWLLARFFGLQYLALGFLRTGEQRHGRHCVDDLLAVAPLSEREILSALLRYAWRRLTPPLLLLALTSAALAAGLSPLLPRLVGVEVDPAKSAGGTELGWRIGTSLLCFGMVLAGGYLASAVHLLLAAGLSLSERPGLMAPIGAGSAVFFQLLSGAGSALVFFGEGLPDLESPGVELMAAIPATALALLGGGLLFYLARRLPVFRRTLGYAFPLIFVFIWAAAMLVMLGSSEALEKPELFLSLLGTSSSLLGVYNFGTPIIFSALPLAAVAVDGPSLRGVFTLLVAALLLQGGLALGAAEFARDALKRRKWGLGAE